MTIEDGKSYTQVNNDIFGALLLISITKRKLKIMLTVDRLTDGLHEEKKRISLGTIKFWTRIEKGNISKPLKELIEDNMLIRNGDLISIQKDVSKWKGVIKLITLGGLSKQQQKVIGLITKKVIKTITYKENPKETFKEKVLTKSQREEKKKEIDKGLKMFGKAIGKVRKRKRENH